MITDKALAKQVRAMTGREIEQLPPKKFDELQTAIRDCEATGLSMLDIISDLRAEGIQNPTFHQVSITARRAFIEEQLGVEMDSRTALDLSEIPVPTLRERMNRIDQLNVAGALLIGYRDLTEGDRGIGIRIELVRPDILVPRTETIEANLTIYQREGIRYHGEGVPLNRSDGLLASTERLETNVTYLKELNRTLERQGLAILDIREAGDLLAENTKTLELAVGAIRAVRPREDLTIENLRTYVGRIKER